MRSNIFSAAFFDINFSSASATHEVVYLRTLLIAFSKWLLMYISGICTLTWPCRARILSAYHRTRVVWPPNNHDVKHFRHRRAQSALDEACSNPASMFSRVFAGRGFLLKILYRERP